MPNVTASKRQPWLAALLSLLMPGFGQLYCGAIARCLGFLVLSSGTGLIALLALMPRIDVSGSVVVASQAVALLIYVVGVFDAYVLARRTRGDYVLKDYNRWYVYLMLYVAVSAGHLFSTLYVRDHLVQPFKAGSDSMYPTIAAGEQVLASKHAYVAAEPEPGDVVTFHNPGDRRQIFVKRVIAVGGDRVEVRDGQVFVNGARLERQRVSPALEVPNAAAHPGLYYEEVNRGVRYLVYESGKGPHLRQLAETTVPPHHCFVLGDNRDNSLDSRSLGAIPSIGITGKVEFRYAPLSRLGVLAAARD